MDQTIGRSTVGGVKRLSLSLPRLRLEQLWMFVPPLVVTWMGLIRPLPRPDLWWHLKSGEVIVRSGHIPRVDIFSFTRAGQPFIDQNWLGEIIYYLAYRAGGFPGLIILNTSILLLTLVPIYHLCFRAGDRAGAAVLSGALTAFTLGLYSSMRPQSYSFLFFAVFYWVLWNYRAHRRDDLWLLPLLMVLWVNMHGAFVLGIVMEGVVLGAEVIRRVVRGARDSTLKRRALAKMALVFCLTLLATLVNPVTYRVFAYVHRVQVDPASQAFVMEWQVPDIKILSDVWVFFAPFFLLLLVLFYSRRRLDLTELGLFLAFSGLAFAAIRSSIWFVLIAAPILARHIDDLEIPDLREEMRGRPYLGRLVEAWDHGRRTPRPVRHRLNWAILLVMLACTILLLPWVRSRLGVGLLQPQLVEHGTPVGAMDFIEDHHLVGHIFHTQIYGDYLIWRLWPQQNSFIDTRVHLYDEAFVRDYLLTFSDHNWESRLARYDIKYLLLSKEDRNAASMIEDARESPNWTLLYEDDISVLFGKTFWSRYAKET